MAGMDNQQKAALNEALDNAESAVNAAVEAVKVLLKQAKKAGMSRAFQGQIDSYLLPHLKSWVEDESQPGSIPSLRDTLNDGEE